METLSNIWSLYPQSHSGSAEYEASVRTTVKLTSLQKTVTDLP